MNINNPQHSSWLFLIAAIVLWLHFTDTAPLCTASTGGWAAMMILRGPNVFSPSCRLHRFIGFLMQFWLKAKAAPVLLSLSLSQLLSSQLLLVLLSQGLVLVLIKAVSSLFLCKIFPQLVLS